jgi:hypothetical protein
MPNREWEKNMNKILVAAILAGAFLSSAAAAAPELSTGGSAELVKAVDARAAKLGKIASADAALVQLASQKAGLVRVTFNDLVPVQHAARETVFVGHHLAPGVSDFAWVTFPDDVAISTNSSAIAIGVFSGKKQITSASGAKLTVPMISARVLGVIDGVTYAAGVPSFAPNSPIRVYERSSKKSSSKKETAPKP